MIKLLSENGDGTLFPEMILVSIPNTDRNRDLTQSRDTAAAMMDKHTASRTGGGELFLSFLGTESIHILTPSSIRTTKTTPSSPATSIASAAAWATSFPHPRSLSTILAMVCCRTINWDRAVGMFKKSLFLRENPETRKKLTDLERP